MANCKSCDARIIWTLSPAGAKLGLDARTWDELNQQGVMVVGKAGVLYGINRNDAGELEAVRYTGDPETAEGKLYVSHWITCPTREQHRKGR